MTQRTRYIERFAPLNEFEHQYIGELIRGFAGLAERLDLPADAAEFWRRQAGPSSPDALVNYPRFAYAIGHVVTVGTVPGE